MAAELGAALRIGTTAAVLLPIDAARGDDVIDTAVQFATLVQDAGAAVLLDGRPDLVTRTHADGAHLAGPEAIKASLPQLKPNYIAGAGGLRSRHDAMVAAEAGADYVMFGEPDARGSRPPFEAVRERVAWWSELFETPCVAYADAFDQLAALARAGADFIAMGDALFRDPRGLEAAAADAGLAIKEAAA